MRNRTKFQVISLISMLALTLSGCVSREVDRAELAMSPGMIIELVDGAKRMTIERMDRLTRSYILDGYTNTVKLASNKIRYYGSKGASGSSKWNGDRGINRAVLSEGQQHFYSADEAVLWLNLGWNGTSGIGLVYTDTGLAIGYKENILRRQINIDVWQIYINGKKPVALPGACHGEIRVFHNKENSNALVLQAGNYKQSKPAVINGIEYSGRALDMLKEFKRISSADVENALRYGKKQPFENVFIYDLHNQSGGFNIRLVVDPRGKVLQVYDVADSRETDFDP